MRITSDKWKDGIDFVAFIVTGRYYNSNRRFRSEYDGTLSGYHTAMGINLWNGRVWGRTEDGKRKLLKIVTN